MHVGDLLKNDAGLAARALAIRSDPDAPFPVLSAKIKLTWRCNLRCGLCDLWQRTEDARDGSGLDPALVCNILDSLHARGLLKIHFSGGEVMMYKYLPEVIAYARQLGLQVNLTTNGTLLDRATARFLVEQRVHAINVSIDAGNAKMHDEMRGVPGAWKLAWEGVENLLDRRTRKGRGPIVGVNTLVTRRNADTLDELYSLLAERGVDRWRLLPVDTSFKKNRPTDEQWTGLCARFEDWRHILARLPMDWSSERSAEFAQKGKYAGKFYLDNACFAPWFNVFVDADGAVYPCCMGKRDMRPCGNVGAAPVETIISGGPMREIRCSMAAGHTYPICGCCDDFLEENESFRKLYNGEDCNDE